MISNDITILYISVYWAKVVSKGFYINLDFTVQVATYCWVAKEVVLFLQKSGAVELNAPSISDDFLSFQKKQD